jgi:hypothetical protein
MEFLAGIYYDQQLHINSYSIVLNLVTRTVHSQSTNIAMDRLKAFVLTELANTVFVNQKHMEQAEMLAVMGVNVTTLPEEPVDQIIGMMLYYKLNAVMEGRMTVDSLDLCSALGDEVWYRHDEDDASGPFAAEGWWHEANTRHSDLGADASHDNVLKVMTNSWSEYGLQWLEDAAAATGNTVVFANFNRDEN